MRRFSFRDDTGRYSGRDRQALTVDITRKLGAKYLETFIRYGSPAGKFTVYNTQHDIY